MVEQFTEARVQILNTNISFEGARGVTLGGGGFSISLSLVLVLVAGSGRNFRTRLHSRSRIERQHSRAHPQTVTNYCTRIIVCVECV